MMPINYRNRINVGVVALTLTAILALSACDASRRVQHPAPAKFQNGQPGLIGQIGFGSSSAI